MAIVETRDTITMKRTASPSAALLRLLAASPALLGAFPAFAADEPPAKEKIQQVEIKGAAQQYDARRNDTATKIVVTQEEILKNGDTTVGEVLKRLPGVTIGGVQGRGGDIRMRGLGAGYTQVMLNGEPAPPGFSLDSLSPDMIERIEVMRAATAEYSTQAIAGGINIVLKRAVQTAQRELKFGLQDDNGQLGTNSSFQLSDRAGFISYAISGNLTYGTFVRPSAMLTEETEPSGRQVAHRLADQQSHGVFKGLGLSPRINFNLGPGDVVTWQTFFNSNKFRSDVTERIATQFGPPPYYAGTDVHVHSDLMLVRSDLTWSRKLAQGAKFDLKGGVNYNKRETEAPSLQYIDGNVGPTPRGGFVPALDRLVTSDSIDKGFTTTGKYATPIIEHHMLATGWDAGFSTRNEDRVQLERALIRLPQPPGQPGQPPGQPDRPENLDQVYDANIKRLAVFVQDEWQVTDRWSVYLGLRWEGIQTRSEGSDYTPVDNKSSVWSPLFQTLWKLPDTQNDQVRMGLTRTYKAPAVNALIPRRFASNNNSETQPDQMGNPLLKPELAWGLDLAYEHYLPKGGMLSASTFVRRIDNSIHNKVDKIDGAWVSRPINDGVANTHGIELEAKLPLRSVLPTAPAIEVRANLSRNWSTLASVPGPNNRLDSQTPVSGTFGLDYKMDTLPLTTGASFSFQSGGPVNVSDHQRAWTAPKRTLDWYGVWKFDPKNQLRVSVSNWLHQTNVAQNGFVTPNGNVKSDTTLTPTVAVVRALLEMKF